LDGFWEYEGKLIRGNQRRGHIFRTKHPWVSNIRKLREWFFFSPLGLRQNVPQQQINPLKSKQIPSLEQILNERNVHANTHFHLLLKSANIAMKRIFLLIKKAFFGSLDIHACLLFVLPLR
jgi:hypothetical protein